jgi:Zn-dependent protease
MATAQSAVKSILHFSRKERIDLLVSWLTLSLAFGLVLSDNFLNILDLMVAIPVALLAVGTGFIFHELAHREAAKSYGFHSEFRAWYPGLAIAVGLAIATGGRFIFAAPGATYFFGNDVSRKQNGIISVAGPATNIVIGLALTLLAALFADKFIMSVFIYAGMINFWFAFFNLIPFGPLDGSKVLAWNPGAWIALIAVSAVLVFFPAPLFSILGISLA